VRWINVAAATGLAVVALGGVAVAEPTMYLTTATGAEEVPARSTTAEAKMTLRFSSAEESASFTLRITEPIENVTMAHLHRAPAGVNGPVVAWLYPSAPPANLIPGTFEGLLAKDTLDAGDLCFSPTAPYCIDGEGDWAAFQADVSAGAVYLNVHTSTFPGGEVRGQLSSPGTTK
jgi:hypothetical protein